MKKPFSGESSNSARIHDEQQGSGRVKVRFGRRFDILKKMFEFLNLRRCYVGTFDLQITTMRKAWTLIKRAVAWMGEQSSFPSLNGSNHHINHQR